MLDFDVFMVKLMAKFFKARIFFSIIFIYLTTCQILHFCPICKYIHLTIIWLCRTEPDNYTINVSFRYYLLCIYITILSLVNKVIKCGLSMKY